MSKYQPLYSSIWSDDKFENYSSNKKLLFIFLLTNQFVEKSGIYKISIRQIAFYTGLTNEVINEVINELINEGKIQYDFDNSIIFVNKLFHYQRGMIKNENILLLTIKRNYELVKTSFWNEFFDVYSNESITTKIKDLLINESLMAHQLYINNNKNNNKNKGKGKNKNKENPSPEKSLRPTLQEIKDYCLERKNSVNPEKWMNHYEANGWKVGKNPMKNWKACVRTWENSDFTTNPQTKITNKLAIELNKIIGFDLIIDTKINGYNELDIFFESKEGIQQLKDQEEQIKEKVKQKIASLKVEKYRLEVKNG